MTNKIQTGDVVMSGPMLRQEASQGRPAKLLNATWTQRGILATGAHHTHDEIAIETPYGIMLGDAEPPHYILRPYSEEEDACKAGKRIMAVFRWHEFVSQGESQITDNGSQSTERPSSAWGYRLRNYCRFQDGVTACVKLMADRKLPYDDQGIRTHARNYLRSLLPFKLPILGKHVEYAVYCTEGCFAIYRVNGIDLNEILGFQPLPSPIHFERLIRQGCFVLVADYGLMKILNGELV